MTNLSKINLLDISEDIVVEILMIIVPIFEQLSIEYFVVGGFARDLNMYAKEYEGKSFRKTVDVDFAVMVSSEKDFENLKANLLDLEHFSPHSEPYRLWYKEAYEVDLLPFGEIANSKGEVILADKKVMKLKMPGFLEVLPSVTKIATIQGIYLSTSSLTGIILLKLLSFEDRPERTKDVIDIQAIITHFYLLAIEEIIEDNEDLIDLFDGGDLYNELVAARYFGRKMAQMTANSPELKLRLSNFLEMQHQENARMPTLFQNKTTEEEAVQIIEQLYIGINEIKDKK